MPPAIKTEAAEEKPAEVAAKEAVEEVKKPVAKKAAVKTATKKAPAKKPAVKKAPAKKPAAKKAPAKVPAPKSVLVRVIGKAPVVISGYYLYPGESKLVHWSTYLVAHKVNPGRLQVRVTPEDKWQGSPPNKYIQ